MVVDDFNIEFVPLNAVTGVVGPGSVDFGIECNQITPPGAIRYSDMKVSAVAISPN